MLPCVATICKIISDALPAGVAFARNAKDLISELAVEFVHMLATEANEASEKSKKKTIGPEHIIEALETLGYQAYVPEVIKVQEEVEHELKAKEKRQKLSKQKLQESGLTQEELEEQQAQLFKAARERMEAQSTHNSIDSNANSGHSPHETGSSSPLQEE